MAEDMAGPEQMSAREKAERRRRIVEALTRGDLDQAHADVEELRRRCPPEFDVLKFAALVALHRNDLPRAHEVFLQARDLAPDAPSRAQACAGLCEVFMAGESAAGGETYVREALDLEAGNPEFHKLLARCLLAQGRIREALASLRQSMDKFPARLRDAFSVQLAGLLVQAGRADEALAAISGIGPPRSGDVDTLVAKATLLQAGGRADEAAECYRRALEAVPGLPCNHAFMDCLGARAAEERGRLVERLAGTPEADIHSRIDLHFALAKATHAAGDYDLAFHYLRRGNQLKRGTLLYDPAKEAEAYEAIRRVFGRGTLTVAGESVVPAGPLPIFIVGMPRSGTTLAEQILGAHPAVAAAGELPFIDMLAREFMDRHRSYRDGVTAGEVTAMAGRYLALLQERSQGRPHVTDKMPLNFRHLGLIRLLFPRAPIIHCQRDAMDTCFSCYQQLFEGSNLPFCYDLQELSGFHRLYRDYMDHWRQALDPAPLELHYEDLVEDAEGETRRLLAHCGLPFDAACLSFHTARSTVLTASRGQVRKPLYKEAVGKWRRYEKHLGELMRGLADPPSPRVKDGDIKQV